MHVAANKKLKIYKYHYAPGTVTCLLQCSIGHMKVSDVSCTTEREGQPVLVSFHNICTCNYKYI